MFISKLNVKCAKFEDTEYRKTGPRQTGPESIHIAGVIRILAVRLVTYLTMGMGTRTPERANMPATGGKLHAKTRG